MKSDVTLIMPNNISWHLLPCINDPCDGTTRTTSLYIMTDGTQYAFEGVEKVKSFRDDKNTRIEIYFTKEEEDASE